MNKSKPPLSDNKVSTFSGIITMNAFSLLSRFAATATLAAMALFSPLHAAAAELPDDQSYARLAQAQPADQADQLEVLEFFAYTCPYCAMFSPYVERWSQDLPEGTVIKRVPVAFNDSMSDLQRMYYTLEALNRLDLHNTLFDTLHKDKQEVFDAQALTQWAVQQGIDEQEFTQAFNSFGVQTKANRANELVKRYQVEGTPTLAIGGRYITSPAMAQGYDEAIEIAQQLLDYSLQQAQ